VGLNYLLILQSEKLWKVLMEHVCMIIEKTVSLYKKAQEVLKNRQDCHIRVASKQSFFED